jgi:hypothetical protein
VQKGIGCEEYDQEGRALTAEYEDFYLVNILRAQFTTGIDPAAIPAGMGPKVYHVRRGFAAPEAGDSSAVT